MWKLPQLIVLIVFSSLSHGAKILAIFPVPSLQHQTIFRAVTEGLEDRGHEVTIISTDSQLARNGSTSTEIDLHFSYVLLQKALFSMSFKEVKDELDSLEVWFDYEFEILEKQFENDDVQYLLRNKDEKFDLVLVENVGHSCWYAFAEYFNAPLVGISATEANLEFHEIFGNSANPIRDPDFLLAQSEAMTFTERFRAWKFYIFYNYHYKHKFNAKFDKLIKKHFPDVKSSSQELKESMDLMLINTHPGLNHVRPIVPTTIQLGFLHIKSPREIDDEALQKFIDQSEKPIIYMNFGAGINSSNLQQPFIDMFQNVFKAVPFDVIWKWEEADMTNKPNNVFIKQWLPQYDLLANPKIKLFITSGGQLSIEEAIDRAVPMLVFPFFGNQGVNAMKIHKFNIGLVADIHSLNEQVLRQLIDEVIYGQQYRENILKLQNVIHDVPMKPVEKAVWWIEYTVRHNGTKHFRYRGRDVPFYKKYMLDFVAIAVVYLLVLFAICKKLFEIAFSKVKEEIKRRIAKKNENPIARKIKRKKKE